MKEPMSGLVNFDSNPHSVELREVPVPEIGEDDVLVAVQAVSICGSDVHQYQGKVSYKVNYPVILGHEFSGVITQTGSRVHAFKLLNTPFLAIAVILGLMSFAALALFAAKAYLGLGPGGMERMILYPILIWGAGLGGYLIASSKKGTCKQK